MVDVLPWLEVAAEVALHHPPMFGDLLTSHLHHAVAALGTVHHSPPDLLLAKPMDSPVVEMAPAVSEQHSAAVVDFAHPIPSPFPHLAASAMEVAIVAVWWGIPNATVNPGANHRFLSSIPPARWRALSHP
jgi:hypothetical protein